MRFIKKGYFFKVLMFAAILTYIGIIGKSCYADAGNPVNLGEANVKGQKLEKKKKEESLKKKVFKSLYSASVITKKEIEATNNPMNGIVNVLNQKPSIYSYSSGPNGVEAKIYMRGFTGGQIAEQFDGIPLNNLFTDSAQSYTLTYNNVPFTLGNVSSINIYRGINNPGVSSFDSLGGTINFNPIMPTDKFNATIFGGWGSFATTEYGASINTGKLPYGIEMYVKASQNNSNGWVQNSGDTNDSYYMSLIKPYNSGRSDISFIYMRNDNKDNDAYTNYTEVPLPLLQQYGYTFNYPTNLENSNLNDESWYAILGLNNYINEHLSFSNKAFYNYNHSYIISYTNPNCSNGNPALDSSACSPLDMVVPQSNGQLVQPFYIANYGSNPYDLYTSYQNEYGDLPSFTIKAPRNEITLGGQFIIGTEVVNGDYINNPNGTIQSNSTIAFVENDERSNDTMYVQDKISVIPKRLFVEPGLKYNVVDTSMSENGNTYDDSIGGTITNGYSYLEPSLGLSYNLLKNWIVYGSWGKMQAVPSITSYYDLLSYNQTSSSTIPATLTTRPEYITDYELGTRFKYNNLKLSINGYKEDFQNTFAYYTDNSFTPPVTNTYNAGNSRYEGVEFEAEYKINRNSGVFGNWSDNTAVYTTSFIGSATGTSTGSHVAILAGEHLSDVPAQLANLGAYTNLFNTYIRVWGTYTGEQYVNDQYGQPTNLYHIGGYAIFNGYLSHNFDLSHIGFLKDAQFKAVKVSLSVDNILNRDYYPYAVIGYNTVTPPTGSKFTYDYENVVPGLPRFFMVSASVKF